MSTSRHHTRWIALVASFTLGLTACTPVPVATDTAVCGEPPQSAVLAPSNAPDDPDAGELEYVIVAEHGLTSVELDLLGTDPEGFFSRALYVETGDHVCVVPADTSLLGDDAIVRVRAVGEAAAAADGESSWAEAYVGLAFSTLGTPLSEVVDETSNGVPAVLDATLLVPVVLGEWSYFWTTVDIGGGSSGTGTSTSRASLFVTFEGVERGGTSLTVSSIETASGASY